MHAENSTKELGKDDSEKESSTALWYTDSQDKIMWTVNTVSFILKKVSMSLFHFPCFEG
jgi:hypothetical protein